MALISILIHQLIYMLSSKVHTSIGAGYFDVTIYQVDFFASYSFFLLILLLAHLLSHLWIWQGRIIGLLHFCMSLESSPGYQV